MTRGFHCVGNRFVFAFLLLCGAVSAQSTHPRLATPQIEARVEALLSQMTLEEKLGQMVQYSVGDATGPNASNLSYSEMVARGAVGSILNVTGADATNRYQRIAVEKSRLHIPLLFGFDVIHGYHTTFPVPLALAASWDPGAVAQVARVSAVEARGAGIAWVFSPMVDIARDPRWGRIVESSGEDPYLGSALARAWVRGYQQDDLSRPDSVAVSVKHFAAYGAAIAGRDYNGVEMGEITLRQVYLEPYRAAVEAGAATMMSAFNSINGVPATANPFLLTQVLRKEWGFDGFVVSDWGAVRELLNHSIGLDEATVARKALMAGLDMDMESDLYGKVVAAQVRSGRIPQQAVDDAVRRILRVKFALGLFEHPYAGEETGPPVTPEHRALARQIAAETVVLLKNDSPAQTGSSKPAVVKPLLPLSPTATVALIGPMADDRQQMLGAWAAHGDPQEVTTLKAALRQRIGARLLYAHGCDLSGGDAAIGAAVAIVHQADVAVVALGEDTQWMEGEASSRATLNFTGAQQRLLEAVAATGKPVVLVVLAGRPLELTWAAQHVAAILEAWSPGIEAGPALADLLYGDANPSGKLPASLPRSVGQQPLYYAQLPTGRPAHGDLSRFPSTSAEKFMSRYMDEDNSALFPFGWGLSYTSFSYAQPVVSRNEVPVAEVLASRKPVATVAVEVRNTGRVTGTEVVQMYLRTTGVSVEQPVRELKGFARITLAPGESRRVEFPLGFDELSFYNARIERTIEPAAVKIWVGGSSLASSETSLRLTGDSE
jgi:beta-glucosidase